MHNDHKKNKEGLQRRSSLVAAHWTRTSSKTTDQHRRRGPAAPQTSEWAPTWTSICAVHQEHHAADYEWVTTFIGKRQCNLNWLLWRPIILGLLQLSLVKRRLLVVVGCIKSSTNDGSLKRRQVLLQRDIQN